MLHSQYKIREEICPPWVPANCPTGAAITYSKDIYMWDFWCHINAARNKTEIFYLWASREIPAKQRHYNIWVLQKKKAHAL